MRPLIVITGTLRVEGGEHNRVRNEDVVKNGTRMKVVMSRSISRDRRAANVIVTDYMRKLRHLFLTRTPYGVLLDPARLPEFQQLLTATEERIKAFSSGAKTTRISNCVLWERLNGERRKAVRAWLAHEDKQLLRQLRD